MNSKTILLPNLLILSYTLIMYNGSLMSGHISRTVLLLIVASALPLLYGLIGKMWAPVKIIAILINIVLFCMFAYTFSGISYMLIKHGTANPVIYAAVSLIFIFVILVMVLKKKEIGITFNIFLVIFAAAAYLLWNTMPLRASFNAAIFGITALISALNVYSILVSLIKRK